MVGWLVGWPIFCFVWELKEAAELTLELDAADARAPGLGAAERGAHVAPEAVRLGEGLGAEAALEDPVNVGGVALRAGWRGGGARRRVSGGGGGG